MHCAGHLLPPVGPLLWGMHIRGGAGVFISPRVQSSPAQQASLLPTSFFSGDQVYPAYRRALPFSATMSAQQEHGQLAFDASEILVRFLKYAFEGVVVAVAAYFIPGRKMDVEEILIIALVAAATFAVLDLFAPSIGQSARMGAGFGMGANLVGFPGGAPVMR